MTKLSIDDSDWADRARLRCPEGHASWVVTNVSWHCGTCGRRYNKFLDTKTGEWVAPGDVRLTDGHRKR